MKQFVFYFLMALLCLQANAQRQCAPDPIVRLFDSKSLVDWDFFLKDTPADANNVFQVKAAAIQITGEPFGYMRTKKEFGNFKLHLEYRWPVEATNSGIFLNMQLPDTIWPTCYEIQLMAGNAGDIICMGEADMKERTDKAKRVIPKRNPSNEVPVGDWNTVEAESADGNLRVYINGLLQNEASGLNFSKGYICLQSEGKLIEFRNVYLIRIDPK